jgi:NADPH2:quinone reductase
MFGKRNVRAAWYDANGPAEAVLVVGELPDPAPGPGAVRVRVAVAGVNPADVKRRAGAGGRRMASARVVPGDDGAGVIDAVGPGVDGARVGERVWVHAATLGGASGTCAELVVVSRERAVPLPAHVSFAEGACLGVPALTAHRAVHADGPVTGQLVLVTGAAGAVGGYAVQWAKHGGASVIAAASTPDKREAARALGADHIVDSRDQDAAVAGIEALAGPQAVDRIVEVAFGAGLPLAEAVLAVNGTVAAYGSDTVPEPTLRFYPLMRRGATLRLVSVFTLPTPALAAAVADVSALLERGVLVHRIGGQFPLAQVAAAHVAVERGEMLGKVVVAVRDDDES